MKVKKIKTATQILFLIAWAFSTLLFSCSAHSFEFQDYEKKIKNGYSMRSAVEKMPKSQLEETLRQFVASGRPNRLLGTPGHDKAREFIEAKLKAFTNTNASFKTQEFTAEGKKAVNLIWQKKGTTSPHDVIVLGANYDTLLKDPKTKQPVSKGEMPGADNNASGVAILLSMAEVLNKLEIPKTVILVFFDAEEFGAQGSKEFTKSLWEGKTFGFINVTMVGHDSKINDVEKRMNNMSIYIKPRDQAGADVDLAFAKFITETGKRNYSTVEFFQKETFSGDYFPNTAQNFWAKSIPAVTMTQNREGDLNPRFMTSNDFPETLNFNTYTNVFRYIMSVVLSWNYDIVK